MIASIVGAVIGKVGDWFLNEQEMKAAEKQNRARLLKDEQSHNHDWEMANLIDKDKWLRRISFTMFSIPFVWALFDPEGVSVYFEVGLSTMPDWYKQMYFVMVGGVWGVAALKNSLPGVVSGIINATRKK